MVARAHKSQPSKRHLDSFSHFAQHICVINTQTDTQTTLRVMSVEIVHIYALLACYVA